MTKLSELKKVMLSNKDVAKAYAKDASEFELASAIIAARTSANLTQEQLAAKMKAKQAFVARIESGGQNTTVKTLLRIADATGKQLRISFD